MSHPSREDLTAYSLGALEPAEQRSIAAHTDGCDRCERELRALAPAVGVLAESVEQLEPPPELRERLMAVVSSEAAAAAAEPGRAERPARRRRRRGVGGFLLRPAAGLAAIAIAIAAVAGYLVAGDGGGEGASTVPVATTLPGAGGSLVVQGDQATLRVHGMPPLAKGVYQVWVAEGAVTRPTGTLAPTADGTANAAVPEAAGDGDMLLVTREPRAGLNAPTSAAVLEVELN